MAGGGILKQLEVETLSLRDVIELTITLSDNVATNALVERCGAERVNAYLASLGLGETRILGPVDFARTTHDVDGGIGISTPREQTMLLTALARGSISSRASASTSSPCSGASTTRIRSPAGSAGTRTRSITAGIRS